MSKNKTSAPASKNASFTFIHPINKDTMYEVCWARATDTGEHRVAIFSMHEIHVPTGIKTMTHNSLSILQITPRDAEVDEQILEIGSSSRMHTDSKGDREIYSHTFFPGRRGNPAAEEAHRTFVDRCATAVMDFIRENQEQYRRYNERRQEVRPNPLAEQLRNLASTNRPARRAEVTNNSD